MRICFVSAALPPRACGIGDYTDRLAAALASEGVECVVVTTAHPYLPPSGGLDAGRPYEIRPVPTHWRFGETPGLVRSILDTRPDLVHIQFPGLGLGRAFGVTALPWALLARHPRLPVALTLHEFDRLSPRHRARVAVGALPCRLIVTPGGDLAASAKRYLGWRPRTRMAEIPLASNLVPAVDGEAGLSEQLRRRPDELVVGYWGFWRPDKGLETLVGAFRRIRATQPARLVLAGDPGPDLDYVERIRGTLAADGLVEDYLETGPLPPDRLSATLLAFDVCVLPFRDGLAANRGSYKATVAHGIPVVTTSRSLEGREAESNTFFVSPGDVSAMAAAAIEQSRTPHRSPTQDVAGEWADIARRHVELYAEMVGG